MMRRTLAFYTALCLLASLFALPAAASPTLACRITGKPMSPIAVANATTAAETQGSQGSCCAVAAVTASVDADGNAARYVLPHPGCCELRVSPARHAPLATLTNSHPHKIVLWVPSLSVPFVPRATEVTVASLPITEAAPRAPPLTGTAGPRAPPLFS